MHYLSPENVPKLPINLTIAEAMKQLVPHGFSDVITVAEDSDSIAISVIQGEAHNNVISIPQKIFNPSSKGAIFPHFILQVSTLFNFKIDYFNECNHLVLNQNQLIYLAIHHRLTMLRSNKVHYSDLLNKDIVKISQFGEYSNYSTINSIRKTKNSYIILDVWNLDSKNLPHGIIWKGYYHRDNGYTENPIGEMLDLKSFNKEKLTSLFRDLDIQPASESMASENNKFVVAPHGKAFYKATGYGLFKGKCEQLKIQQQMALNSQKSNNAPLPASYVADGKYFYIKTIFDTAKANIPARFKSHVVSDSYSFPQASRCIFQQDIINKETLAGDGTKINALVVFDDINPETDRLTCGEAEVSAKFATQLVFKDETIKGIFKEIYVKEGDILIGDDAFRAVFGKDDEDNDIVRHGFKTIEIKTVEDTGINGSYKIVARCTRYIGSGRVFSNTGFKAVTKPKPSVGRVKIEFNSGDVREMNVDIVTGMNAVKAKHNTIMLAKAALAFELDQCNDLPYLNSMNEQQISDAANTFEKVLWTDQNGVEKEVYAGIIQVSVNELSYMFNHVKPQSFMPESGRFLYNGGHKELFNEIWEHNVDPDNKAIVLELQKIILDNSGYYINRDKLPVYSTEGLRKLGVYDPSDLKFEKKPKFKHVSKLLDEDYNKGFYLDLRYRNGGYVRFPSAKLLNTFVGQAADGEWIYPQLFINVSNCLECCISMKEDGTYNIGFLNNRKQDGKKYRVENYIEQAKKILHSDQNFASTLLKPKVLGVGMKQMVDCLVPRGVVVISDTNTYSKLAKEAGYEWDVKASKEDNPSIPHFRGLCIRNPVVWKTQAQAPRVWSKEHFRMHLLAEHNINIKDYLLTKFCSELLLMHPDDALHQQSDVDGDLMPLFVPKGLVAQRCLSEFREVANTGVYAVDGVCDDEVQWIEDYKADERESNKDLCIDKGYKLYDMPYNYNPDGNSTLLVYFADSIIAKGDVALATHNNWAMQNTAEIYFHECAAGNVKAPESDELEVFPIETSNYICYVYSRLVQDFVIRGIKHNAGGSTGFTPFLMANMCSSKYSNGVIRFLKETVGMPQHMIKSMMNMVHWATETTKIADSVMQFQTLHNRGKEPKAERVIPGHFNLIVDQTFYGMLTKPLFDIRRDVEAFSRKGYMYSGAVDTVKPVKSINSTYSLYTEYGKETEGAENKLKAISNVSGGALGSMLV
jgi:hypothetical protein